MTKTFAFSSKDGAFLGYVDKEMDMLSGLPDPSTVKRRGNRYTIIGMGFSNGARRRCHRCGRKPAPNNIDYRPYCDRCMAIYWDEEARKARER